MPTVLREGPYRLYFYSSDGDEPSHIHVQRDDAIAKYWLKPIRLEYSISFRPIELRRIQAIIEENRDIILENWNEYFGQ